MASPFNEEYRRLCETVPEIQLYFMIEFQGRTMFWANHEIADGRITGDNAIEVIKNLPIPQQKITYAVSQTTRFGVTQPFAEKGGPSEQYKRWYLWWDNYTRHLASVDSDSQDRLFEHFNRGCTEADVAEWRPEGDWRTPEEIAAAEASSAQN